METKPLRKLSLTETGRKEPITDYTRVNRNCKLEKSWIWPEQVTDLVKSLIIGKSINVCSGASALGDVKIDLEPIPELQTKNNIQIADMNKLPFEDNSFDTVISDPPWKLSFFKRMKPFLECVRICKVGGRIIYNCYWRPVSKYVELEQAYIRTDNNWSNVSVIWVFKKTKEIDSDSAPAKPVSPVVVEIKGSVDKPHEDTGGGFTIIHMDKITDKKD